MDTTAVVVLVVVALLVVAALAWLLSRRKRSSTLQQRFGPEYERTVEQADNKRAAERELKQRADRRDALDIRPLDPIRRDGFSKRWQRVQEDFVDHPAEAVTEAQRLVHEVMQERGYPVDDSSTDLLSVDHADVMEEYRSARSISELNDRQEATTEQLRRAMVHYRTLLVRLLADGDGTADGPDRQGDGDQTSPAGEHHRPDPERH